MILLATNENTRSRSRRVGRSAVAQKWARSPGAIGAAVSRQKIMAARMLARQMPPDANGNRTLPPGSNCPHAKRARLGREFSLATIPQVLRSTGATSAAKSIGLIPAWRIPDCTRPLETIVLIALTYRTRLRLQICVEFNH